MDKSLAEKLVAELEKHPPLTANVLPDRDYFVNLLAATDMPQSRRFYEEVGTNQKYIRDSAKDQHHFLSIRRVLRNGLAGDYQLSKAKGLYETLISTLGIHDSDVWTIKLRMSKDLVRMMTEAMVRYGQPFSLLGELKTFDEISGKVAERPLLVIPNTLDLDIITTWEIANRKKPKEGVLDYLPRISRKYI